MHRIFAALRRVLRIAILLGAALGPGMPPPPPPEPPRTEQVAENGQTKEDQ
jgi:hypothetical protein